MSVDEVPKHLVQRIHDLTEDLENHQLLLVVKGAERGALIRQITADYGLTLTARAKLLGQSRHKVTNWSKAGRKRAKKENV